MTMEAIHADDLHKTYGRGDTEVKALQGVSIVAHPGEVVALLGPSGSGKTTLLTALGLLNPPEKGRIRLMGQLVVDDGRELGDMAALRRARIGFVFQKPNLVPFLTAHENVRLALAINDRHGPAAEARAQALLDDLGVGPRAHHFPEQLSGGEQQRVAIARALASSPAVVLADEPTAALDSQRGRGVMELFRKVAREHGTAVVMVTHDHRTLDLFDRIFEMEDGRISAARSA